MAEPTPTPQPPSENKPWSLRDLKGTAAELIEEVQAAAFVPDEDKAAIIAKLKKADPKVKFWRVDVHLQCFSDQRGPNYIEGSHIRAL